MLATIELEAFIVNIRLPDGLRWREWNPANFLACEPAKEGSYISRTIAAIERASDGEFKTFEVSSLSNARRGEIHVSAAALALAVDKAIAELET